MSITAICGSRSLIADRSNGSIRKVIVLSVMEICGSPVRDSDGIYSPQD